MPPVVQHERRLHPGGHHEERGTGRHIHRGGMDILCSLDGVVLPADCGKLQEEKVLLLHVTFFTV